ncbi:YwqG family protein [Gracilibacillus phocaeensis]|uniref:YwqG family protein n=1 Tax=Gracilibacillus phocaeensis TaxID=2042304 RepID=UPI00102FB16A|nr:DUF1963 domain-containing protein [Gracilibacillus phocaeensis]
MSANTSFVIPKELEAYRPILESTLEPVLHIQTTERKTSLWESKFGGNPYFPLTMEYPKTPKGHPLRLLAQINFADLPEPLPSFPPKGILQFYIDGSDDMLGLDIDGDLNQSGYRVLFHDNVIEGEEALLQNFSFLDQQDSDMFPVEAELALSFEPGFEPLSTGDFRSRETYAAILEELDGNDALEDAFYETFDSSGHRIGGYPFFIQGDPRDFGDFQESTTLLLQLDSDDDIMWGDVGVANFFISKEDLEKRDFSKVLYNWDCS